MACNLKHWLTALALATAIWRQFVCQEPMSQASSPCSPLPRISGLMSQSRSNLISGMGKARASELDSWSTWNIHCLQPGQFLHRVLPNPFFHHSFHTFSLMRGDWTKGQMITWPRHLYPQTSEKKEWSHWQFLKRNDLVGIWGVSNQLRILVLRVNALLGWFKCWCRHLYIVLCHQHLLNLSRDLKK